MRTSFRQTSPNSFLPSIVIVPSTATSASPIKAMVMDCPAYKFVADPREVTSLPAMDVAVGRSGHSAAASDSICSRVSYPLCVLSEPCGLIVCPAERAPLNLASTPFSPDAVGSEPDSVVSEQVTHLTQASRQANRDPGSGASLAGDGKNSIMERRSSGSERKMNQHVSTPEDLSRGVALLGDPVATHGTAFTVEERRQHGLEGLLPHAVETLVRQAERVQQQLDRRLTDLDRYIYLIELADPNETLFYYVVMSDPARFIPVLYWQTWFR